MASCFLYKRRQFITLVGGAAVAWPLAARGQQSDTMRRIGVMIALPESDPELKKWIAAFLRGLEKLGWSEGRNVRVDYRFAPAGARAPEFARELLALQPDVVVAFSIPVTVAFQRATQTVPIVFIGIADAIAQGLVRSLAHPDGNLTGLTMYEASVSGKYLSMLKEIEPQLTHAAFLANPRRLPITMSTCGELWSRRRRSGSRLYSFRSRMTPPMSNAPLLPSRATCRKEA
jgi:putative tryptophan/tyrosine transport system substrate-binding protein